MKTYTVMEIDMDSFMNACGHTNEHFDPTVDLSAGRVFKAGISHEEAKYIVDYNINDAIYMWIVTDRMTVAQRLTRFHRYICFKLDTFPDFERAQMLSAFYPPITVDDKFEFYNDDMFMSNPGIAENLNCEMELRHRVIGARTAIGWFTVDLFIWLIDHRLDVYLRRIQTDGYLYTQASKAASFIRGFREYEKSRKETGTEKSSESAQATA